MSTTKSTQSKKLHLRGVVRVLGYASFVSLVLGTVAMRSAYADWKESALVVGRELSQFEDLVGQSHRLRLNGEPVYVASAQTEQPVQTVLGRFETLCKDNAGSMPSMFAQLPENLREQFEHNLPGSRGLGVIRQDAESEGYVACLAQKPGDDWTTMASRLQAFGDTGDLSKVGNLRYVYAKRRAGASSTHVVTVWTEGPFKIGNIAPDDGREPPGSDPENAPRPVDAVRLLSAEIEGAPYAVRMYDSPKRDQDVLAQYDRELPKLGWEAVPYVSEQVKYGRAFQRQGVEMLVFALYRMKKSVENIF